MENRPGYVPYPRWISPKDGSPRKIVQSAEEEEAITGVKMNPDGTKVEEIADLPSDAPPIEHETVHYADGSSANGPAPLPRVSPEGFPAVALSVEEVEADKLPVQPVRTEEPAAEAPKENW